MTICITTKHVPQDFALDVLYRQLGDQQRRTWAKISGVTTVTLTGCFTVEQQSFALMWGHNFDLLSFVIAA